MTHKNIQLQTIKKQDDEINNLTNYLKRINEGIYDLEILDNTEGDLSILKNEIYKTTIMLNTKRQAFLI